jgi:hypothetical protein
MLKSSAISDNGAKLASLNLALLFLLAGADVKIQQHGSGFRPSK